MPSKENDRSYTNNEVRLVEMVSELERLLHDIHDKGLDLKIRREKLREAISIFESARSQYKSVAQEGVTNSETKTRLKEKLRKIREDVAAAKADIRSETVDTNTAAAALEIERTRSNARKAKTPSSVQGQVIHPTPRSDRVLQDKTPRDDEANLPASRTGDELRIHIEGEGPQSILRQKGSKSAVKEKMKVTTLRASTPTGEEEEQSNPFDGVPPPDPALTIQQLKAQGRSQMDETDKAIDRSRAIVAETEEIGIATAAQLQGQRVQLEKIGDDLESTQQTITAGNALLRVIRKQMVCDRCQQVLLLVITLGIVAMVIVSIQQDKL
mmetsp:Transcript_9597/g.35177  ORF Transcript_9597/g.35177 Transcript_9597/m.35177 type:complete len:326 (-) Transcript_9597:39-1016(-)